MQTVHNYTGASQVVAVFFCPSSTRQPDGGRDGIEPAANDGGIAAALGGQGYGYNDYGPTCYTDISPIGIRLASARLPQLPTATRPPVPTACSSKARPRSPRSPTAPATRSPSAKTPVAIRATSSPYTQNVYCDKSAITMQAFLAAINPNDPGPAGGYTPYRRYWRWAEPDESYGVSGAPNNKFRPDNEGVDWPNAAGPFLAQGNNAGNNDELSSFHPGGVNVLMGDGSVRFLKDSVNVVTLRGLVTLSGGEVHFVRSVLIVASARLVYVPILRGPIVPAAAHGPQVMFADMAYEYFLARLAAIASFLEQRVASDEPRRFAVVDGHLAAGIDRAAGELAILADGVERHVERRSCRRRRRRLGSRMLRRGDSSCRPP